jgi:hypothetical protein
VNSETHSSIAITGDTILLTKTNTGAAINANAGAFFKAMVFGVTSPKMRSNMVTINTEYDNPISPNMFNEISETIADKKILTIRLPINITIRQFVLLAHNDNKHLTKNDFCSFKASISDSLREKMEHSELENRADNANKRQMVKKLENI